jgi:tetratricopeptide (TPR) repeat protein
MKSYPLLAAITLAVTATAAWPVQHSTGPDGVGDTVEEAVSSLEEKADAARHSALINDVLGRRLLLSCNKCRAGFALKVLEQAVQKPSAVGSEQLAEVERLRTQGQALYNEGKFKESLELLQQAEAILGIDASGDPIPPTKQTSGAAEESVLNR